MKLEAITITEQFQEAVEKRRKTVAVTDHGEAFTWEEIDILSDNMAVDLLYEKVEKGSHIAICGENSIGWICAFLSIVKVGAIAVLLNPKLKEPEALALLQHADVEYLYYDDIFAEEKASFIKKVPGKFIKSSASFIKQEAGNIIDSAALDHVDGTGSISYTDKAKLTLRQIEIVPKDFVCILFTSGTTSLPKGVILSHYQLINIAREATKTMKWNSTDRVCLALPMFHCFGLSTGLLAALVHGGSLHISSGRKSNAVMQCIEENACTVLNAVPSLFLAMLCKEDRNNYNLSSLYSGIIAGSDVQAEDFLRIVRELGMEGLMQSYGQTEASPSITFTHCDDSLELRSKSVGKKISNIRMEIMGMETGEFLGPYSKGEIIIRGYNVMKGYYKNEAETAEALLPSKWLKTGDIGYLDEEGNLYVTGRKKDIIIRCGENISPKEIEEAILASKLVSQVKVFGIPAPVVQEEIVACIEVSDKSVTEETIKQYLKDRLAAYKIPKYIFLYLTFPMNANGKVDSKTLKEEVQMSILNKL